MRRTSLALGASMLTVALGGGDATADTPPIVQQVTGTIGGVQVGPTGVDAPVRVVSPGDSAQSAAPQSAPAASPQSSEGSVGTAQAGSVSVHAPVRVLSKGDDAARSAAPSGGEQKVKSTAVGAQVASVSVHAPVRVLSDGDDTAPTRILSSGDSSAGTAGTSGGQDATGSLAAIQLGPLTVGAPVRVLSPGDDPGPGTDGPGSNGSGGGAAPSAQSASVTGVPPSKAAGDAGDDEPGGTTPEAGTRDDRAGGLVDAPVAALTRAVDDLPFTGLDAVLAACAGAAFLLAGGALRRLGRGSEPCS
jgi:hypothetical protein